MKKLMFVALGLICLVGCEATQLAQSLLANTSWVEAVDIVRNVIANVQG